MGALSGLRVIKTEAEQFGESVVSKLEDALALAREKPHTQMVILMQAADGTMHSNYTTLDRLWLVGALAHQQALVLGTVME